MTTLTNDQITAGAAVLSNNGKREGFEAAAKALQERAAGHFRNKNYALQDECLQCASMLHDLKPVTAPSPQVADIAELPVAGWARKRDNGTGFGNWLFQTKDGAEKHGTPGDGYNVVALVERDAIAASRRAAGDEVLVSPDEWAALCRFRECCDDFDSGGHDVDKAMMKRLERIGAVRSTGFGRHEMTDFGNWLHDYKGTATPAPASAGQAGAEQIAQQVKAAIEDANSGSDIYMASLIAADRIISLLAAQPAEGAGQAVAFGDQWHSLTCDGTCSPPCKDAPIAERAVAPADHEIREVVNQLRDVAVQFHAHQSLRDRIASVVLPLVRGVTK